MNIDAQYVITKKRVSIQNLRIEIWNLIYCAFLPSTCRKTKEALGIDWIKNSFCISVLSLTFIFNNMYAQSEVFF